MSNANDTDKLSYVLTVLKHTELNQPDYHAVATEAGINNANNAQKRFKAIIESAGLALVNKQVVANGTTPVAAGGGKPAKAGSKKKATTTTTRAKKGTSPKKRKIQEVEEEDQNSQVDDGEGENHVSDAEEL